MTLDSATLLSFLVVMSFTSSPLFSKAAFGYQAQPTWFSKLFGFVESPHSVKANIDFIPGESPPIIYSKANHECFQPGLLEVTTLRDLRLRANEARQSMVGKGKITVREIIADVKNLHADPANAGAFFQVASQFNLLEVFADVTLDYGITGYERDRTQGPACAIACAAGTLYRNYEAQTTEKQIDCLELVGKSVKNGHGKYWKMKNGYALLTGAVPPRHAIEAAGDDLKIGIQHNTEVTLSRRKTEPAARDGEFWNESKGNESVETESRVSHHLPVMDGCVDCGQEQQNDKTNVICRHGGGAAAPTTTQGGHLVTQAYCSALPLSLSRVYPMEVAPLARMVLNASYEATFAAAVDHVSRGGKPTLYLTLLGGGAFGNPTSWIIDAAERALRLYHDVPLDVVFVSYGRSNPDLRRLLTGPPMQQSGSGGPSSTSNPSNGRIDSLDDAA